MIAALSLLALSQLADSQPPDTPLATVIYTTDTTLSLAACGCGMGGQAGTIAHRAGLIDSARAAGPPTILCDLGNLCMRSTEAVPLFDIAQMMRYDLLCPSQNDLVVRPDFKELAAQRHLTCIADGGSAVVQCGSLRVGIINLLPARITEAPLPVVPVADCDLLVLVSHRGYTADRDLAARFQRRVDLVVELEEARYTDQPEVIDGTAFLLPQHRGSILGLIDIFQQGDGFSFVSRQENVVPRSPSRQDVRDVYETFLAQQSAAAAAHKQPVAPSRSHWGYAPASTCVRCHQAEAKQWQGTAHAQAMSTLQDQNRLEEQECRLCHSQLYRASGSTAILPDDDDSVQCACCHGDGKLHALTGNPRQVIRDPGEKTCLLCHTEERDSDFDYPSDLGKVKHQGVETSEVKP